MIVNIVIGMAVFGYAGWALIRFINRSKEGKCAGCAVKNSCSTNCIDKVKE
ncbi:FeoB-associated Cys-rich membrane protein [Bacillus massilinigeriensis]|uniref:FeoB-associated Cys-rich membrane protein n=1 Tax=Bacillus massilionigeriensis TaxID=1805475 RepID=UPI00096B498F|nr:FeoB-associated Cys-rich membrane protein [Bacillus massilionigeriensis]